MHRTAVLLHTLPSGESHFDWLIDQPAAEYEHRLLSWRCAQNPAGGLDFRGELLPDHRAVYLDFEGSISGNRGYVQRIASGFVQSIMQGPNTLDLTIQWANSLVHYTGHREDQDRNQWGFAATIIKTMLDE